MVKRSIMDTPENAVTGRLKGRGATGKSFAQVNFDFMPFPITALFQFSFYYALDFT